MQLSNLDAPLCLTDVDLFCFMFSRSVAQYDWPYAVQQEKNTYFSSKWNLSLCIHDDIAAIAYDYDSWCLKWNLFCIYMMT